MACTIIDADNGDILARVDNIEYIRQQDNGAYGLCPEQHAQGVSDGNRAYQLVGRPEMTLEPLPRVVIARVDAAQEAAALSALVGASFRAQVIADRAAGTGAISDAVILQSAGVVDYPQYEDKHAYDTIGEIIRSPDGLLFEVKAKHTSNATAYPLKTTFAYYRLIELAHAGTLADPIPYPEEAGILVNVVKGKYYSYKGAVYKATQDVPNNSWYPGQPGVYHWEKVS